MRRPKLLLISPVFPPAVGGIETLAANIAARLDDYDIRVLTLDEVGAADWGGDGKLDVRRFTNRPRGGRRAIARLTFGSMIHAALFRPDVVLSMHVRCGMASRFAQLCTGAAWVQYYHAKEIKIWDRAAAFCLRHADANITVSAYTANLARSVGTPRGELHVIPPGVLLPGTQLTKSVREESDELIILSASRLEDEYKGHDVMFKALPEVLERDPRARWVVIGDGRLRSGYERDAERLGLASHVSFLGRVSDEERDGWLMRASVFALPSRVSSDGATGEGFGIVYLEAAAHGVPVVAGAEGGALDAVSDGRTGLLVDPRNPGAIADAIVSISKSPERMASMRAESHTWAQQFKWENVVGRVAAVLVEATETRAHSRIKRTMARV